MLGSMAALTCVIVSFSFCSHSWTPSLTSEIAPCRGRYTREGGRPAFDQATRRARDCKPAFLLITRLPGGRQLAELVDRACRHIGLDVKYVSRRGVSDELSFGHAQVACPRNSTPLSASLVLFNFSVEVPAWEIRNSFVQLPNCSGQKLIAPGKEKKIVGIVDERHARH